MPKPFTQLESWNTFLSHYRVVIAVTMVGLVGIGVGLGGGAFFIASLLILLEVVFSFDNAIINAKMLARLSAAWRRLFLTVGVLLAVFGLRFLLPIFIVALSAHQTMGQVFDAALHRPAWYAEQLNYAQPHIASFGGMFLLLVFLDFMLNGEREVHWLAMVERPLSQLSPLSRLLLMAGAVVAATGGLAFSKELVVLESGLLGIASWIVLRALTALIRHYHELGQHHESGLMNFIYLELVDASFSLDSVIGAFALSNSTLLIALGLGIGALWVRSMTLHIVHQRLLLRYIYLEHGAHYAIGALGMSLLLSVGLQTPQLIVGLISLSIVILAFVGSWLHDRRSAVDLV